MSEFNFFEFEPCRYCGKGEIIVDEIVDECFFVCCDCGAQGPTGKTVQDAYEKWNAPSDEVLQLRARIAELEAQTRWIPVSERLPEDMQDVAVLDKNDHQVTRWNYSPWIVDYFLRNFSHWMPWEKWLESTK